MAKIRVKVPKGKSAEMQLAAYYRIVHQDLRYAEVIDIDEIETNLPYIEFIIEVKNKKWAERVIERIKSFSDFAELIK